MDATDSTLPGRSQGASVFATTHWSMVLRARKQPSPDAASALEKLCRAYWYPPYAFVRRQGHDAHTAQDLTQEFFGQLIENQSLRSVDPSKGRFRSFLIPSVKHLLANEWKHARRQKRGGGQPDFSLDEALAEGRYGREPVDQLTPEKAFERRWAEALLQRVLDRLRDEWDDRATSPRFEEVKSFLIDGKEAQPFADVAQRLNITEASLKWVVHRLRKRYGEIFREEIAHTVSSPEELDDEIRHLFSVMSG